MIGHDVEFFLSSNGNIIPAATLLKGSKGKGVTIARGVLAHPDNIMAEISSAKPFPAESFRKRILHDVAALQYHVHPAFVTDASSVTLDSDFFKGCPSAEEVGCDADFHLGELRPTIKASNLGNSRYAGGHLHFDVSDDIDPSWAAGVCDILLGSYLVGAGEKQGGRRKFYGLPNLYRPKPYGVEYRTMSNFWVSLLQNNKNPMADEFCRRVYLCSAALEQVIPEILELPDVYGEYARNIIETENQGEALNLAAAVNKTLSYVEGKLNES